MFVSQTDFIHCVLTSSSSSSSSSSAAGPSVQQPFLVVSDRHPSLSGQSLHGVALSYGTLPRAPRRAPPPPSSSSTASLPRPRAGSAPAPPLPAPQSLYATLCHPRRSANATTNGHYRQPSLPINVNGSNRYAAPPLRGPGEAPGQPPGQPLRLDMPPETDWRRDADCRAVGSSWDPRAARLHQPLHRSVPHQPPPRPRRDPQLCSLCQQLPAEPARPYCQSCGTYVARFRPIHVSVVVILISDAAERTSGFYRKNMGVTTGSQEKLLLSCRLVCDECLCCSRQSVRCSSSTVNTLSSDSVRTAPFSSSLTSSPSLSGRRPTAVTGPATATSRRCRDTGAPPGPLLRTTWVGPGLRSKVRTNR
ncbi:hypothetical protein EYF80_026063 [Liparis tanakae]|uniref:Uncharacterized protein n=1 Tax=Liparis tanakae TaxID=230148 RepID=A0A4Z2HDG6_9TELE|nr:hypothetical protein EYF80_026063 [Liparis tanakae]